MRLPKRRDISSDYIEELFDTKKLNRIIMRAAKNVLILKPDTIVCRGNSGVAVAFAVSALTNVMVGLVRKSDGSHSSLEYEGACGIGRYVVIDDFIETGTTLKKIKSTVMKQDCDAVCLAVVTYEKQANSDDAKEIVQKIMGEKVPDRLVSWHAVCKGKRS